MTTTSVRRPPRVQPPQLEATEIEIAAPPPHRPGSGVSLAALLLLALAGAAGLALALAGHQTRALTLAGLAILVVAVLAAGVLLLIQSTGSRRMRAGSQARYLDYLDQLRTTLRETVALQQAGSAWRHPRPAELVDVARRSSRRWERRPADSDFLVLRIGTGQVPLASRLTTAIDPETPGDVDRVCLQAMTELQERFALLPDQPVTLDLSHMSRLVLVGDEPAIDVAVALVLQISAQHSPADVALACLRSDERATAWDWLKWVPHVLDQARSDGDLPARRVVASPNELAELLAPELEQRLDRHQRSPGSSSSHLVVVVDAPTEPSFVPELPPGVSAADLGVHVIQVVRSPDAETADETVTVNADGRAMTTSRQLPFVALDVPPGVPALMARQLAPFRAESVPDATHAGGTVGLPELLGIDDAARLDPTAGWRRRADRDRLRVPIGVGPDGPVSLDLKESAQGGMGPHGLVAGATGSGKSELLRTLVTSLVLGHGPDELALMLVDFKGGATFAPVVALPHVTGIVTNLQDDLSLVDRMRDALYGELQRRQELLRTAGNLADISAYRELLDTGGDAEPLPHLLVIVDEFSELLGARPDFADLFATIGRIGRSMGIHLLLATQRLDLSVVRGVESHLSYRIGLRTFSEAESRDVLGAPDAYHLPPEPGSAILKVDTTVFRRFRAALVSGPYEQSRHADGESSGPVVPYLAVNGIGGWLAERARGERPEPDGRSVLEVLCQSLAAAPVSPARRIWLDPLPAQLSLDAVVDSAAADSETSPVATLGLVDDPTRQSQFPLRWDAGGSAGNLVIAGGPRTGASTLARTLVVSLCLTTAPGDVVFYCLDFGGGSLQALRDLPHVAAVVGRLDPELVSRVLGDVVGLLESREQLFREHGLSSMADLRRARADGRVPHDVAGDVFLVVDGWHNARADDEEREAVVADVAARGLAFGIHVVLTVAQPAQVRLRMQASFGGHLELRLTDAYDSAIDRARMDALPRGVPGRGLVDLDGGLVFQAAEPRIDGGRAPNAAEALHELVVAVSDRWPEPVARLRVLPTSVRLHELPAVRRGDDRLPVGLAERDLSPVFLSLAGADPHLLVLGDAESGKSSTLRLLAHQLAASRSPKALGVVVVDPRRSLTDAVPYEHLVATCSVDREIAEVAAQVAETVRDRRPGPDVTADQLRARSWWSGPDVVVLVDDYDLVTTSSVNPLQPLLDLVSPGRDLGLHLVVARRTGGMSRASFEPLLQRLTDLGTPGLLLSGDPHEGRLIGGVAAQRFPPGRAHLVPRGSTPQVIQLALPPS